MKLDIVVGNPPYQDGNQSIYQKFINEAININPTLIIMITKNNWINSNVLEGTRNKMIEFGIVDIINYPIPYEIFKQVHVAVSIFKLQKEYKDETQYKEIQNSKLTKNIIIKLDINKPIIVDTIKLNILNKVINEQSFESYNLPKNARIFSIASNGNFMFANYTEPILQYTNIKQQEDDIEVIFLDSSKNLYTKYTSKEKLPKGKEYIYLYKVVCGSKVSADSTVYTNLNILKPNQILTNSFNIIGLVNTEYEANAIYRYAKTKFHRFMAHFSIPNGRITYGIGCTEYVPMQNFTSSSDINWNSSIEDIDNQLYTKYKLTEEEIHCIETVIKSIN